MKYVGIDRGMRLALTSCLLLLSIPSRSQTQNLNQDQNTVENDGQHRRQLPPNISHGLPSGLSMGMPPIQKPHHATAAQPAPLSSVTPSPKPVVATSSAAQVTPSLYQQPPQPATLDWQATGLTIKAENASLAQILSDIAQATGMKEEGPVGGERVFGTYGPASPKDVISALLDGTAYNVMMVGDSSRGAPRLMTLTTRSGTAPATVPPPNTPDEDEDTPPVEDAPPDPLTHPPDNGAQPQGSGDQVKTPEELLRQMQQQNSGRTQSPPQ